jgi:SAM-dependent methyltransferase
MKTQSILAHTLGIRQSLNNRQIKKVSDMGPLNGIGRLLPRPAKHVARQVLALLNASRARARLTLGISPLSYRWGHDRGNPLCRAYLDQFLQEFSPDIKGHCLEFQKDHYATRYGGSAVDKLDILHVDDSNPLATIIADLTRTNHIPSNHFDCIICTHVLHIIFELDVVVSELYRVLKQGGVLLVAVPAVAMIDSTCQDFWRFTPDGLAKMLAKCFRPENVTVRSYGNSLTAAGQVRGLVAQEFSKAVLNYHDPRFAVEVCARSFKQP